MATPLKLKDANGNIQELTTTEENYIAYQVGLHLSTADSAEVGSLNRATTGDTVGTYSNTFFNQAVGTHPSTSITTGTTNTVIYQTTGTAAETDANVFRPIMWVDSASETGFKMMPDVDLNAAVDRYLSKIFTNEYPGSYRLSTSAPSSDWTEQQTAFIDTRTDGASIAHKLWKRTGGTAPTAVKPMRLKNEASFAGVQEMSDTEIKFSFGQRAKTRIAASKIGSYQLRNSSQGAPTDTGTWVAKGTATDTKNTTANQAFTRDSTINFQESYTTSYTTAYATNFTSISNVAYTSSYARVFDQGYSIDYTGGFNQTYTSTFTGTFSQNYDTAYTTAYTNNFLRNTDVVYSRNFANNFLRNTDVVYSRNFVNNFTRTSSVGYVNLFTSVYQANYERIFTRISTVNYAIFAQYNRLVEVGFAGQQVYVGPSYQTTTDVYYQSGRPYTGGGGNAYYNGPRQLYYQGSGRIQGTQNYITSLGTDYLGGAPFPGASPFQAYARTFVTNYLKTSEVATTYTRVDSNNFYQNAVNYTQNFVIDILKSFTVNYTRNVEQTYTRNFSSTYQREFVGGYTTNYVGNYANEFVGGYTTNYVGDYQNEFSQSYTKSYTTGYLSDYDGAVYTTTYERAFTGVYSTAYEGAFNAAYSTAYEGNYENIYDKAFDTSYITDYLGNFQGNFEGETIQSANATNETYTLYVRIS